MPAIEYKRLDYDAALFLINYLLAKLKTSPLADNTTYTLEKSQDGMSVILKDGDGTTITTISGLLTDAERTKLGQNLATEAYVQTAIAATSHLQFRKVQALPLVANAEANIIYLVPVNDTASNVYMEYYLQDGQFEELGTTSVDLSGYVQASQMKALTNQEITTIVDSAYTTVFGNS